MGLEFQHERAQKYISAMQRTPYARGRELEELKLTLDQLAISSCTSIVDLGAGHGFVTQNLLLDYLADNGIVYAVDGSEDMLSHLTLHPKIRTLISSLDNLHCMHDSIDLIVSLAVFHHITYKKQVFLEVHRVLKRGSYFVLVDICDDTKTQVFFDNVVRKFCRTGHDFDFLDRNWVCLLADKAKIERVSSEIKDTPWKFGSESELIRFVKDIFL